MNCQINSNFDSEARGDFEAEPIRGGLVMFKSTGYVGGAAGPAAPRSAYAAPRSAYAALAPNDARAIARLLRAAADEAESLVTLTVEVPVAHVEAVRSYVDSVNGEVIA